MKHDKHFILANRKLGLGFYLGMSEISEILIYKYIKEIFIKN